MRTVSPQPPTRSGVHEDLHWAAYEPTGPDGAVLPARAGVLVLHGADSRKENQADFCRAAAAAGLVALGYDQRGHGATGGAYDGRAVDDAVAMAGVLRGLLPDDAPVGLRGSSMGGWLALVSAAEVGAGAIVAVCPAASALLRRGLANRRLKFPVERESVEALLDARDERAAAPALDIPVFVLHAENDEIVPVAHSRELAGLLRHGKYVEVPGGHHRSIQHDPELLGETVRWLSRALSG